MEATASFEQRHDIHIFPDSHGSRGVMRHGCDSGSQRIPGKDGAHPTPEIAGRNAASATCLRDLISDAASENCHPRPVLTGLVPALVAKSGDKKGDKCCGTAPRRPMRPASTYPHPRSMLKQKTSEPRRSA